MHELATVSLLPTDQVMLISMRAGRALSTPPRAVALPAQELQDAGSPLVARVLPPGAAALVRYALVGGLVT